MQKNILKKGFTLVELLIVLVMMGILAVVFLWINKQELGWNSLQLQVMFKFKENIFNPAYYNNVQVNKYDKDYMPKGNEVPQKTSLVFNPKYKLSSYVTVQEGVDGVDTDFYKIRKLHIEKRELSYPPYSNAKQCVNDECQAILNEHFHQSFPLRINKFVVVLKDWTELIYKSEDDLLRIEANFDETSFTPTEKVKFFIGNFNKINQADFELDITDSFDKIRIGFMENKRVLEIKNDFSITEYTDINFKK